MKVFSISDINIENNQLILVGNFTTIITIRAVGSQGLATLLSNNYPKE